ncbi:hypothetical protein QQ045_019421 [Rhodiola kirilowii]
MTLLDVITAAADTATAATATAAANAAKTTDHQHDYPTVLDPETGLRSLHKSAEEPPNPNHLVYPVSGFKLLESDNQIAEASKKCFNDLSVHIRNTKKFERKLFEERLCKFLIKVSHIKNYPEKFGLSDGRILIERFGNSMGRDVAGLVMDGCVLVENLDWIEALILNKLVPHFSYTKLIDYLVEKRRSDLICEFVKNSSDLKAGDILTILRYCLVPSKEARSSMSVIRKEWEREAIEAADRVSKFTLLEMKVAAKERAVLLMMAYDGFSDSELCLHYLFAVISVDELVWTSAICKLNGKEMMALIGYLGKWLRKYNRFPKAVSCPEASLRLKLKAVNWLPKIKDIVNCLGLVIDEHFSTLVLHKEFHDEMRSLDGLVGSLVLEARLCCSLSNVVETLKSSELLRENPCPDPEMNEDK